MRSDRVEYRREIFFLLSYIFQWKYENLVHIHDVFPLLLNLLSTCTIGLCDFCAMKQWNEPTINADDHFHFPLDIVDGEVIENWSCMISATFNDFHFAFEMSWPYEAFSFEWTNALVKCFSVGLKFSSTEHWTWISVLFMENLSGLLVIEKYTQNFNFVHLRYLTESNVWTTNYKFWLENNKSFFI